LSLTDPPSPEIYPLSLHDALPISWQVGLPGAEVSGSKLQGHIGFDGGQLVGQECLILMLFQFLGQAFGAADGELRYLVQLLIDRSEEHTSELQSRENLVCRLLLEK